VAITRFLMSVRAHDEFSGCTAPESSVQAQATVPTTSRTLAQLAEAKRRRSAFVAGPGGIEQCVKIHGQAWTTLASVSAMSSSRDDADISLARRIANAIAAGDRDEAIRLARELERALTNRPGPSANAAPSFAAQPAVVPMTYTPTPRCSARQVIADALAEIGVACRAKVATDYAEARFGQHVEPRTLAASSSALTTTDAAVPGRPC
jgi:hypothetical protein